MKLSISAYAVWVFSFVAAQRVQQPLQQETVSGKPVQVAIIGAGAAGSSAAYHLSQYAHNASLPINITIFESNSYIGGRSTTVTAYNLTTTELDSLTSPNSYSVELGASIFVAVNHILVSAVQTFNLSTSDDTPDNPKGHLGQELGIWDGDKFLLQLDSSFLNGYWSLAKILFRYGLAPIRTHALTKSVISKFLKIYESPIFPFKSLTAAAQDAELLAVTAATGEQYLRENGISEGFAREVVQASTRVNYAQNLEYIHGLETMVCMATDGGARSVKGGNWRIFEEMVKASGASVNLGKRVSSVTETRDEKYRISLIDGDASEEQQRLQEEEDLDTAFDHVVVASPWQYANVEFGVFPEFPLPDKIPYVRLHVTLFTSPYLLDPEFFNVPKDQAVPQVILTTLPDGQPAQPGPEGVGRPGFFSISLLRPITNPRSGSEEYLYKIFSPGRVSDDYLAKILNSNDDSDDVGSEVPSSNEKVNVTWIYRKIWNSYPYETPRVAFEDVQLRRNVWYTGGMDNFISTMETNALMGKNVAKLIADAEQSEAERRRGMQMDEDMKARKQDL